MAWLSITSAASAAQSVFAWEPFEIELTAEVQLEQPYVEGLVEGSPGYVVATFTGTSGAAKGREIVLSGFWDGGQTWRIRFAPPATGEWSYRTESTDPGLDGASGKLSALPRSENELDANPTLRGFVRVADQGERAGRYFVYADGTPMLWIGDTWWGWTKPDIRWESRKKLVDDRAEKGFNIGQLFVGGHGWSGKDGILNDTYSEPDFERLKEVDRFIQYANSKGITVWVHGWWSRAEWSSEGNLRDTVGEEKMRRWSRYLVHRLGAYNVIWVIAGEYNKHNYSGFDINVWKRMGEMIDAEDPYERLLSGHPTPPTYPGGQFAPQWSTSDLLHNETWLRYNQSQTGHRRYCEELIPWVVTRDYSRQPAKPIVITEPCYEFILGNPPASTVRFAAWAAVLSGAAGHSYGGGHIWWGHVPESPVGASDTWPMELSFETDTLDYPGAQSVGFMGRFLRQLPWWTLDPHPELVVEYPSQLCSANLGEEYLALVRYGGRIKLDLRHTLPSSRFRFRWIDPADETIGEWQEVIGGGIRAFDSPGRGRLGEFDQMVLHLVRIDDGDVLVE
ncbi:MAG: DUF4038 domain-containing protein [Puniceicoccaceae bacterium]